MALRLAVKCSGEIHELRIHSVDGDSEHLEVEMGNHEPEYDLALHAFGAPLPECYAVADICRLGTDQILMADSALAHRFIWAIKDQGLDALGLGQEEFIEAITGFLDWRMGMYEPEIIAPAELLEIVTKSMPELCDTPLFQNKLRKLAVTAYKHEDDTAFSAMSECSHDALMRIHGKEDKSDRKDGAGFGIRGAHMTVTIGDDVVDEWDVVIRGWFCDFEAMEWCTERDKERSNEAYYATGAFLEVQGESVEDAENMFAPPKPDLPQEHYGRKKGYDWAILHNQYEWGFFDNGSDAWAVFDAMSGSHEFCGVGVGIFLRLMHRTGAVPEGFDDEDDYDPDDPSNWEELAGEDI
jgi:hypothetical protein